MVQMMEQSHFANDLLAQIRNEALKCGNEIEGERGRTQGYWDVESTRLSGVKSE